LGKDVSVKMFIVPVSLGYLLHELGQRVSRDRGNRPC
jgi:hypothetical protein